MNKQGSIKMRNDLQEAVDILSALNEHNALLAPKGIAWADGRIHVSKKSQEAMHRLLPIAIAALRDTLKRREGCEWCHEYIMMDKNYCAECGCQLQTISKTERVELSGNAEQVKEVEG